MLQINPVYAYLWWLGCGLLGNIIQWTYYKEIDRKIELPLLEFLGGLSLGPIHLLAAFIAYRRK